MLMIKLWFFPLLRGATNFKEAQPGNPERHPDLEILIIGHGVIQRKVDFHQRILEI